MLVVNNPGTWSAIYPPLHHAEWNGWTPTDLIFPFFLFIVGVAMTGPEGRPGPCRRRRRGCPPLHGDQPRRSGHREWPSGAGSGPHASSRPARARSKACPGPGRHSGKPFDRRRIPDCRVDPDKALRHNGMAGHWTNRCGPGPATASIGLTSRPAESIFSPPTVRGQWCSPRTPGCPAGGHRLLDTMRVTGVTLLARPARNARRAVTAS